MRISPPGKPRAGFTLVEMLIAAALMAVILGAAYACLQAGLQTRKLVEPRGDAFQAGRVALGLLAADLRSACPLHKGPEFLGSPRQIGDMEADNLDFATHYYTPRRPGEGDYASVSWFVERNPTTGEVVLWRRRNPTFAFDPLSGGAREEIADRIRGFKLEYYDGYDWYDTWGDVAGQAKQANSLKERPNLVGMPEAVRATLLLDSEPTSRNPRTGSADPVPSSAPPLSFQTIVKLAVPQAGSQAGASDADGAPGTSGSRGNQGPRTL